VNVERVVESNALTDIAPGRRNDPIDLYIQAQGRQILVTKPVQRRLHRILARQKRLYRFLDDGVLTRYDVDDGNSTILYDDNANVGIRRSRV